MKTIEQQRETELLARIHSYYLDSDGSCYLYDKEGKDIEEWPESWPKRIANVRTFMKERGIGRNS